jgi:hypothetical protein
MKAAGRSTPLPTIWIGHADLVRDLPALQRAGVRALIDLALAEAPITPHRETVYCRFPLIDGGGNPAWIVRAAIETVTVLARSGTNTLVFCGAGMSRSPAVCAGALSLVTDRSPEPCLAEIARGGPTDVSPALWREVLHACGSPHPRDPFSA